MDPNQMYASPVDIGEGGGGLYQDCWVRFEQVKTVVTTKFKAPTPCLEIDLTELESGETHNELMIAGSGKNWAADGKHFHPTAELQAMFNKRNDGSKPQITRNNDVGAFAIILTEQGFQWDMATFPQTGWTQLSGHWFWATREDLTDRDGNTLKNDKGYTKTKPVFTQWGGNGAQPNEAQASGTAQATQAAPDAGITDADKALVEVAVSALIESGPKSMADITNALVTNPPVQPLDKVTTLISSGWINNAQRPWATDKGMLSRK